MTVKGAIDKADHYIERVWSSEQRSQRSGLPALFENPHKWSTFEKGALVAGSVVAIAGLAFFIFRPKPAQAGAAPVSTSGTASPGTTPFKLRTGTTYYASAPWVCVKNEIGQACDIVTNPPLNDAQLKAMWSSPGIGSEWVPGNPPDTAFPPGAPAAWMAEWNKQDRALFIVKYLGPDNTYSDPGWRFFGSV